MRIILDKIWYTINKDLAKPTDFLWPRVKVYLRKFVNTHPGGFADLSLKLKFYFKIKYIKIWN